MQIYLMEYSYLVLIVGARLLRLGCSVAVGHIMSGHYDARTPRMAHSGAQVKSYRQGVGARLSPS